MIPTVRTLLHPLVIVAHKIGSRRENVLLLFLDTYVCHEPETSVLLPTHEEQQVLAGDS